MKIRHQTESDKHRYVIIRKDQVTDLIKKYKGKVENTGRLLKFKNMGEEITDMQVKGIASIGKT